MKKYDIIEAISSHRAQLLTQVKLAFTALFNRYQPPSTSSQPPLQCAATPPDPRCDALVFFNVYRKLSELNLLPWNTIEDLDGFTVNELGGWILNTTPSSGAWGGMKMLSLEKHGKECNPLKKFAKEVKATIAAGVAGKEREVWEFRAREVDCSWEDIVKEVGSK